MDILIMVLIFGFYAGVIAYSYKIRTSKKANLQDGKSKEFDLPNNSLDEG